MKNRKEWRKNKSRERSQYRKNIVQKERLIQWNRVEEEQSGERTEQKNRAEEKMSRGRTEQRKNREEIEPGTSSRRF